MSETWQPSGVHPLADIFPMMTDDELADLAEDIETNGQLHPILIDQQGLIVDGRNRYRACRIAGVRPRYQELDGEDVRAIIVSANLARRNLKKGQQAMAQAMIYPDPHSAPRKGLETQQFDRSRLSQARSVLRHSRSLAEEVLADHISLDKALEQMQEEQQRSAGIDLQMGTLRKFAPDLADLVEEERLSIEDAMSAMGQRRAAAETAEANKRETMLRLTESAWQANLAWASDAFVAGVTERLTDASFRELLLQRMRIDPARIEDIRRGAEALATTINNIVREGASV